MFVSISFQLKLDCTRVLKGICFRAVKIFKTSTRRWNIYIDMKMLSRFGLASLLTTLVHAFYRYEFRKKKTSA